MNGPAKDGCDSLAARLAEGDRRALSRAISLVENRRPGGAELLDALHGRLGRAQVVGVTGPPGAGKSTLVSALTATFRRRGCRIAVLAVDPSSPLSGGAILGDRIRMSEHAADEGVFVRSIANRGHLGGLSATTMSIIDLLDAAGWDLVIVEAVGAGQSEVEIAECADVTLVAVPPGLGDEIQAIKAGILEIADMLVITKADLDPAGRTRDHLSALLEYSSREPAPIIISTASVDGSGIDILAEAVLSRQGANAEPAARTARRERRARSLLAARASQRIRQFVLDSDNRTVSELCDPLRPGIADVDRLLPSLFLAAAEAASTAADDSESYYPAEIAAGPAHDPSIEDGSDDVLIRLASAR